MRHSHTTRRAQGDRNRCTCGRPLHARQVRGMAFAGLPATACVHQR